MFQTESQHCIHSNRYLWC